MSSRSLLDKHQAYYRYYRIYITARNGDASFTSIFEIELKGDDGVDTTSPGMTCAANGNANTFVPANIIDNAMTSTAWVSVSGSAAPWWWSVDLATQKIVTQLTIWPPSTVTRAPKDFLLQGGNDNSTWTDLLAVSGITDWVASTSKTWSLP